MPETKHGYVVNTCNMPGNIIEYREFTRKQIYEDYLPTGVDGWFNSDGANWEDDVYNTYEQAKAEAERQIARDIAALEEDLRDYRAIVLTDPRTTSGE